MAVPDSSMLLVLPNYHKFLGSPEILQCLANALQAGKARRTFIVILSPSRTCHARRSGRGRRSSRAAVCGHKRGRDVLSPLAQKTKGIVVGSPSPWDCQKATWKDVAVESRRISPADIACFRLGFQAWLRTWPHRHR